MYTFRIAYGAKDFNSKTGKQREKAMYNEYNMLFYISNAQ